MERRRIRTMSLRCAVSLPGRSTQVLGDRVDTRCGEVPEHLDCFGERRVLSGDQAQSVRSGLDGLVDLGEALGRLGINNARVCLLGVNQKQCCVPATRRLDRSLRR